MFRKTPVAWRQLMKEKTKLIVAIAGIGFADMLMFIQLGFQDSLYDGATLPHRLLQADLILSSSQFKSLGAYQSFSREQLYQTLGSENVASVSSIYIDTGNWRNPETRISRPILIWGIEPEAPSFVLPEVRQNTSQLKLLNQVLFDRASRPEYGAIANLVQKQGSTEVELSGKNIQVTGLFTMGASFVADGNAISSDSTFLNLFPQRQANQIDVGLIHLKSGVDTQQVQAQLKAGLTNDIKVMTPEEFAEAEKLYWETGGAIGFIFGLGTAIGFVVGTVIVYQILYTDVANHLPEYATLKAMGYSDRYLLAMLLQEALLLAIFGYIPGFLISLGLYQIAYAATLLPIGMKVERAAMVLALTIIMCSISGAIAMRKLRSADPADVF